LARDVGRKAGRPVRDDPWVSLSEVRRAVPADGTLVEVARFRPYDYGKGVALAPRYAAWVIPPQGAGAVRFIDLGEAERIDDAVADVLRALPAAPRPPA